MKKLMLFSSLLLLGGLSISSLYINSNNKEENINITPKSDDGNEHFYLLKNDKLLVEGQEIYISNLEGNKIIGKQATNNRESAASTKIGEEEISVSTQGYKFVIGLMESPRLNITGYTFYDPINKGYLTSSSSSSNYLRLTSDINLNSLFTIKVNNDYSLEIKSLGTYTHNTIKYNSSNSTFSNYLSTYSSASLVNIYVSSKYVTPKNGSNFFYY